MWTCIRKIGWRSWHVKELLIFLLNTLPFSSSLQLRCSDQPCFLKLGPTSTKIYWNFRFISTATTIPQATNSSYLDNWCSSNITFCSCSLHAVPLPIRSLHSASIFNRLYNFLKCSMFLPAPVQHVSFPLNTSPSLAASFSLDLNF